MKEFRMYFAIICIAFLATLSGTTSASESESHRAVTRSTVSHVESDDDSISEHHSENKKEVAKKIKERLEKIEKLRKKNKKIVPVTPVTPTKPVIPVTPVTPTKPVTPVVPPVSAAVTKTATITYRTPAGSDPVTFTVTVKDGVITAASSVTKAQNGTSAWYQDTFAIKLSQSVVGKKVVGLNLSAIGGASLTTTAFEQFISTSF